MMIVGPTPFQGTPAPFRPLVSYSPMYAGDPAKVSVSGPTQLHLRKLAAEISDMDESTLKEFTRLLEEALTISRTGVTLRLEDPGPSKIRVIKEVRNGTLLPLKDAKQLVDATPSTIMMGDRTAVYTLAAALEDAGATVTVY